MKYLSSIAAVLLIFVAPLRAEEKPDAGFIPMFNGKDLTGWVNVNCAPGTFFVKDGEVITTGKPTGLLRTAKQYENFIADFEWMHVNKKAVGNSGFFVWADPLPGVGSPFTRGIEVQVLVNLEKEGQYTSHGDLFSVQGAHCKPDRPHPHGAERCLPSERRCKGGGEWNHYKVIANDGVIKLHVNGKEVSGISECRPRKGYLCLESEGAECHFRNLKIKELPSTNPKPEWIAKVSEDYKNLFTGDLSGWKADAAVNAHWRPRDWVLQFDGKAKDQTLWSEKEFANCEFTVDFRFPNKSASTCTFVLRDSKAGEFPITLTAEGNIILPPGNGGLSLSPPLIKGSQWNRFHLRWNHNIQADLNGHGSVQLSIAGLPKKGSFGLRPDGPMEFANLFVRESKK